MARYSKHPELFDEVKQISISTLKKYGYLTSHSLSGILTWKINGDVFSELSIKAILNDQNQYIRLTYRHNDRDISYDIPIVYVKSNLNKGRIPYFLCPVIGKRCRILYYVDGYFLHREAFQGCFYEKQIRSKSFRQLEKIYGADFLIDEYYEKLHSKHFKKTYANRPTKKYLNLIAKIERLEGVPFSH